MKHHTWIVRSSRRILQDRWITVRADDCVTASGVEVSPYYVLEFPDFIHVVATDVENHVILVRQYRHAIGAVSLELPGGHVDRGEADVEAAARRELHEETGYIGGVWAPLMSLSPDPARYSNRIHVLRARGVVPSTAVPEPTENIEVVRVSQAEALRLARSGSILNAQHVGFLLLALSG